MRSKIFFKRVNFFTGAFKGFCRNIPERTERNTPFSDTYLKSDTLPGRDGN